MKFRGSWLIRNIVVFAGKVFGSDSEDRAGVGPFSLPLDHPFNRGAKPHDWYFVEARRWESLGKPLDAQTLEESDRRLFRAFVAIIYAEADPQKQIELMMDLCAYWPWARKVGQFMWYGPKEENV